ncbi:hypothetical protein FUAX_48870 (plasmid) [Fulvitalea axinellae]|uniref:Uncharacterized protein n=1 Tax=Fulvitalea axinellae TaxID=1182444 RepID=A0AAU9CT79_9BACT|nr:hypothetical protein FUAX_48870 [Fulvitalea axinellae]
MGIIKFKLIRNMRKIPGAIYRFGDFVFFSMLSSFYSYDMLSTK